IEQVQKAEFDILKKLTELEEKYSAKALEVELENKKGIVFYEVELVSTEQGKQKLLINVATGEEIPVMKNKKHK
ncbi:PepSY domain-containing protein, partial [Vibrio sp. 10N.222.49.C9]